jgi:hypothetical protein
MRAYNQEQPLGSNWQPVAQLHLLLAAIAHSAWRLLHSARFTPAGSTWWSDVASNNSAGSAPTGLVRGRIFRATRTFKLCSTVEGSALRFAQQEMDALGHHYTTDWMKLHLVADFAQLTKTSRAQAVSNSGSRFTNLGRLPAGSDGEPRMRNQVRKWRGRIGARGGDLPYRRSTLAKKPKPQGRSTRQRFVDIG